ncbi:MAG: hypothetical protein H7329_14275 [Opitutaceae bacterium]|nr:hypothetical protein [Cytophagales bacterium]
MLLEFKRVLDKLESKISELDKINLAVSKASVGWHIDHTLMATIGILDALKNSDPKTYKWKFNFNRFFVYTINKIPRGRANAPKSVIPKDLILEKDLQQKMILSKQKIEEIIILKPNHYFNHPYFGHLNLKPSIKFLVIHANHHLKIIEDILKS